MGRFGILLLSLSLVLALMLGCGGDDPAAPEPESEPEPVPTVDVGGAVDMPEGWTGDPATLEIVDVLEAVGCDAAGEFTLKIHEDRHQLTFAKSSAGAPVLLGWFGADATTLSMRSTAEVLLWMALGAWMLPGESGPELRALIADPALDLSQVEDAWAQMLTDSPDGLMSADQALTDALQAQAEILLGVAGEKGVIIEPGVLQSGVEVLNTGGINRITIKNSYRRRSAAFLWHTGYKDTNNADHFFTEPEFVQEMELPPVDAFDGTLGTILGAFTGEMAYEPKLTGPITLAWGDDVKRDYYRFNVLGMGLEEPDDPEIYTSHELAQGEWMTLKCLVLDYFFPMLMNAAGAYGSAVSEIFDEDVPGQVVDFVDLVTGALPEFRELALDGQFWPAMHVLWDAALTNGTLQGWVLDLMEDALDAGRFTAGEIEGIRDGIDRVFLLVGIVDIIGNLADSTITGYHFGLCKKAETWDLTVTTPVIHIEPREAIIGAFDTQLLTLVIDDDTGGYPEGWAYAYHWTCTGRHGVIVNPMNTGDTSNDFFTSSEFVQYVADNGSEGEETVTCELYVTLGGDQTLIRDATCELEIVRQHIVLADTLQSCPQGTIEMRPYLEPPHEGEGTILWSWDSPESTGSLRGPTGQGPPWTSTDSYARFLMDYEGGDDSVTCIASIDYGDGNIAQVDTVEAFIEDVSAFEPFTGEHFCHTWFGVGMDGRCSEMLRIFVRFAEIPGVMRYRIHGTGFNDPWYYGTEYDLTVQTQYLQHSGDMLMIELTNYSRHVDCNSPTPADELCSYSMWRFEGAVWEITPVCP